MSNTIQGKGVGQPSPTVGGDFNRVVPMYGMPIRDAITETRLELRSEIAVLNKALSEGDPDAKEVFADGKLEGNEWTEVKNAVESLSAALNALENHAIPEGPGNPIPGMGLTGDAKVPQAFDNGGIHALYGISIMDDVARFRGGVRNILNNLTSAIANGEIPTDFQDEAGRAVQAMKDALAALGGPPSHLG